MNDQCNGCSIKAELAHSRMYAPARRATKNTEPVKAIGPCNTAYWFGNQSSGDIQDVQSERITKTMSECHSDVCNAWADFYKQFTHAGE